MSEPVFDYVVKCPYCNHEIAIKQGRPEILTIEELKKRTRESLKR